MLVQICLLGEALVAALLWAHKWSLFGVDSQVVEEVVPLAEKHLAVGKVTLQNFHLSLCSGILVLQNTEQPCGWDLLFYFYRAEVKILSWLHLDL